jgi:hypothetical protein
MTDKFLIEEWELSPEKTEFCVKELTGSWPFRKWIVRKDGLASEKEAREFIRKNMVDRPRVVNRWWLRADMGEDSGW